MSFALIGSTLDILGKVLLGLTVIQVHTRVMKEHKIDELVLKAMQKERKLGFLGIVLMVLGYLLQLPDKI